MLLLIVLFTIVFLIVTFHREDDRMTRLKERYYDFIQRLPDKYSHLKTPACITGTKRIGGDIGSNVNKGSEIFVCLDGDTNDSFHVLLHELAHSTVSEYDHTDKFWENFAELRSLAQQEGLYEPVSNKPYCGKMISDS